MKTTQNTILITGGSSGIGLGFAEEFLKLGNKVIICGRREERLNMVKEKNPDVIIYKCDVSVEEQRQELFSRVSEDHPETNVLMNNAGIQLCGDMTGKFDKNKINAEIDTNFVAPIHLSSLFADLLKSKKEAAIINISSGLAFVPLAFMPVYCATKAALHSYTLSLRHQLRKTSIKVFEIAPPAVDTELGHQGRNGAAQSHGGITVSEFIKEAMEAISGDVFEAAIGQAKGLHMKREEMFNLLNH
jgi:uncharacterized oxidoreductase